MRPAKFMPDTYLAYMQQPCQSQNGTYQLECLIVIPAIGVPVTIFVIQSGLVEHNVLILLIVTIFALLSGLVFGVQLLDVRIQDIYAVTIFVQ